MEIVVYIILILYKYLTQITHWTLFECEYNKIGGIARRFYPGDVAKATLRI